MNWVYMETYQLPPVCSDVNCHEVVIVIVLIISLLPNSLYILDHCSYNNYLRTQINLEILISLNEMS